MRADGQSCPSLSRLPADILRSVYSSQLSWLGGTGGQKSWTKFLSWLGFESQTSRLAVQHANHFKTYILTMWNGRRIGWLMWDQVCLHELYILWNVEVMELSTRAIPLAQDDIWWSAYWVGSWPASLTSVFRLPYAWLCCRLAGSRHPDSDTEISRQEAFIQRQTGRQRERQWQAQVSTQQTWDIETVRQGNLEAYRQLDTHAVTHTKTQSTERQRSIKDREAQATCREVWWECYIDRQMVEVVSVLDCQSRGSGSNPSQGRNLVPDFCSTCAL